MNVVEMVLLKLNVLTLVLIIYLEACEVQNFCLERCGDTYKLKKIASYILLSDTSTNGDMQEYLWRLCCVA